MQCKTWNCLPSDLEKQEFGLIDKMTLSYNVYLAMKSAERAQDMVKWAESNPDQFAIYAMVKELDADRTD